MHLSTIADTIRGTGALCPFKGSIIPQSQPDGTGSTKSGAISSPKCQKWSNFFPKMQVQFPLSHCVDLLACRVSLSLYTGNVRQSLVFI